MHSNAGANNRDESRTMQAGREEEEGGEGGEERRTGAWKTKRRTLRHIGKAKKEGTGVRGRRT